MRKSLSVMIDCFEDLDEGFGECPQSSPTLLRFGPNGSVRGQREKVRRSVTHYDHKVINQTPNTEQRDFEREERNRCVLYVTSLGIIRETFEKCRKIKAILSQLLIKYELRDIYICKEFKRELNERDFGASTVPLLFIGGKLFGTFSTIEELNETGQLAGQLHAHKMATYSEQVCCGTCGGTRFIPCQQCGGSALKAHIIHFSCDSICLKCLSCDYSGIQKCPKC